MKINYKGRFIDYTHIWFNSFNKKDEIKSIDGDFCVLHANKCGSINGVKAKAVLQYSLITDLEEDLENLNITKTVKNEINRSEREGVKVDYFTSYDLILRPEIIESFSEMFNSMYKSKGMDVTINKKEIEAYIAEGAFMLTVGYIDEIPMVYHSYLYDSNNARLFQSCSEFRSNEKELRNAIGRANKYLHWKDLQYFKGQGVISYDWGGISDPEKPNGIDKFKMSFGGQVVSYYNINLCLSLKAKILKMLGRL